MHQPSQVIHISGREVRQYAPALIIAEVAQAHDGSLGFAHSFIDIAADAGADAIKFQTHIAAAESTVDEKFRVPFTYEDATRDGLLAAHGIHRSGLGRACPTCGREGTYFP